MSDIDNRLADLTVNGLLDKADKAREIYLRARQDYARILSELEVRDALNEIGFGTAGSRYRKHGLL